MADNLTGDFDVVAEFAIPAANRVLASMHRNQRFPHSMALRVDDNPLPGSLVGSPTIISVVDAFGDPTANQNHIGKPVPLPGTLSATNPAYSALDPVVNANLAVSTMAPVRVVPSNLQGRAQLQLSPPTLAVTDASGTNVTVQLDMMSRYFPDPNTSPLAEFIRGKLQITAAVNQVASQAANVIDIDVKAESVGIDFTPLWSSKPLSAADVASVNLVIRNALKTSLLPSNTALPASIKFMQFKTLLGAQSAVGVLLNTQGARGNTGSFNNNFLVAGDDFAVGVGKDFIVSALNSVIPSILSTPISPVVIPIDAILHTFHITYSISLSGVTIDLQSGQIVLTITGHAHTGTSWMPDFDFTATVNLTLLPDGDSADLKVVGVSLDTTSWLVNQFKDAATGSMTDACNQAIAQSGVAATVKKMLSANANLGGFLSSLLNTPPQNGISQPQGFTLAYTSVDIQPSGIILHGSLAVTSWPAADVEFEKIPVNTGSTGIGMPPTNSILHPGPDYSALKSWIPGGTIQEYDWSMQGLAQPFSADDNRFVYIQPPPELSAYLGSAPAAPATVPSARTAAVNLAPIHVFGYVPVCLTVKGSRLSSSGPVVAQPVTATVCVYPWFSILGGLKAPVDALAAMVVLTQPGPGGLVQVTGNTSAGVDATGKNTPNTIVHFANDKTINRLNVLTQSLQESNRTDAPTAVLAIVNPDQLPKATYAPGVVYAEDTGGVWERLFGVNIPQRPATLIVDPNGKVLWQQEGDWEREKLVASLSRFLVARPAVSPRMLGLNLRIGRPSPNFLLEFAPGRELTLRKLAGRPVILVFWRSSLKSSIEAVRDLKNAAGGNGAQGAVVLAINDGDPADVAKKSFAETSLPGILVPDPNRSIAAAYGVTVWPSTVFLDALGLVRGIRYGRLGSENGQSSSKGNSVPSR